MNKNRMETFFDGVVAILITIMVLEMEVPRGKTLRALTPLLPVLTSYVLSFLYLGIYWNNHHHMLHACRRVTGSILWANLHLLFWLSLIPVTTGWLGEGELAATPAAAYGFVLLMAGLAYRVLQQRIIAVEGEDSLLRRAIGRDAKGKASLVSYALALPLAYVTPWLSLASYVGVAVMWVVPDRRIERLLGGGDA